MKNDDAIAVHLVFHLGILVRSLEILIVVGIVHLVITSSLGLLSRFGEVDALAASSSSALDDVVSGDGLEVVAFFFVFCVRKSSVFYRSMPSE